MLYFGLIDEKMSTSDKVLPVHQTDNWVIFLQSTLKHHTIGFFTKEKIENRISGSASLSGLPKSA